MNTLDFNYYNVSLLLGGFGTLFSGIFVLIHNHRKLENFAWFALNLSSSVWGFGFFLLITTGSRDIALVSNWILHCAAICIALFYFLFTLAATNNYIKYQAKFFLASLASLIFILLSTSDYFIKDVVPKHIFNFYTDAGPVYTYFTIYFFGIIFYSLSIIVTAIFNTAKHSAERQRLKYILFFTMAGLIGGGSTFFLSFGINIPPFTLILFALYPAISSYAIFKYKMVDIRVILPQLLTFSIFVFVSVYIILTSRTTGIVANSSLFIVIVLNSIFLMRSINKEIQVREQLEMLNQQKTEFISIASHQIRNPLTSIIGFGALILKGHFGKVPKEVTKTIVRMQKSTQSIATLVGDYLDVTTIEQGGAAYNFQQHDLKELVNTVVAEHRPVIDALKLKLRFDYDTKGTYMVRADREKLEQVISNLLDNITKYQPKDSITFSLKKNGTQDKIILSVADKGIGIAPEDMPRLFKKFNRGKNADSVNKTGTGLGLYVAKKIIEAHKGRIWAESPGEGQGSTFFVELPLSS